MRERDHDRHRDDDGTMTMSSISRRSLHKLSLLLLLLLWSPCLAASPSFLLSSYFLRRGGGHYQHHAPTLSSKNTTTHDEIEHRWHSLLYNCGGNWSGSIGWYGVEYDENTSTVEGTLLVARGDNGLCNMRLSFHCDASDANTAHWVVYHARGQDIKEEVVLQKYPSTATPQLFYCFDNGILGRTGRNFSSLPVIEHGFWDQGMRHTIVVAYNKDKDSTLQLRKICFVQQLRQDDDDEFDASASNPSHVGILPHEPTTSLKEFQAFCKTIKFIKAESILSSGVRELTVTNNTLERLLGTHDGKNKEDMLRLVLPNNVVLVCPWRIPSSTMFHIYMAFTTKKGQVQVVDFEFEEGGSIRKVTASHFNK